MQLPELASDPDGTACRFKDHPALAGYHLRDEPSAGDFPEHASWLVPAIDAALAAKADAGSPNCGRIIRLAGSSS